MEAGKVVWKNGLQRQNALTGLCSLGKEFPVLVGYKENLYGERVGPFELPSKVNVSR